MSYTPGPWSACNDGRCSCGHIWSKTADAPIATIISGPWGDEWPDLRIIDDAGVIGKKAEAFNNMIEYGSVPEEQAKANRILIAAAPELLQACRAALDYFLEHADADYSDQAQRAVGNLEHSLAAEMRAAIAKAEGQ